MGPGPTDGRRRRSLRTRALVVDAGQKLFLELGYVETTIESVAAAAEVAPQTVYYVFGTKRNLLAAVLDARIAGDVEPVPVLERSWFDELESTGDAATAVGLLVEAAVVILARTASIYDVVRQAAADPDVGTLLAENRRRRRDDQRRLVGLLEEAGHLLVDVDTAADVVYGLLNEEVFLLLTEDCGWDIDRFQRWATELLVHQLVAPPA